MSMSAVKNSMDSYSELLDLQDGVVSREVAQISGLSKEQVSTQLANGTPLLTFDTIYPSWERCAPVFNRILEWVAKTNPECKWTRLDMKPELFRELASDWFHDNLSAKESRGGYSELAAIAGASIKPFLQAHSKALMPLVDQSKWRRRYCPICGGIPDFSFLDKEQGSRWLVCSRCDGAWLYKRLECPFCGTQDQTKLAFFTDTTERYRLYVCDACRTYIKAIDLRFSEYQVKFSIERILTLELDLRASGDGYVSMPMENPDRAR